MWKERWEEKRMCREEFLVPRQMLLMLCVTMGVKVDGGTQITTTWVSFSLSFCEQFTRSFSNTSNECRVFLSVSSHSFVNCSSWRLRFTSHGERRISTVYTGTHSCSPTVDIRQLGRARRQSLSRIQKLRKVLFLERKTESSPFPSEPQLCKHNFRIEGWRFRASLLAWSDTWIELLPFLRFPVHVTCDPLLTSLLFRE